MPTTQTPYQSPNETEKNESGNSNESLRIACEAAGGDWLKDEQRCDFTRAFQKQLEQSQQASGENQIPVVRAFREFLNPEEKKARLGKEQNLQNALTQSQQFRQQEILQQEQQANQKQKLAGQYDAARGGFVGTDGTFYPSTNPDFIPTANPDKRIERDAQGNYILTDAAGTKVTLTPEEYETTLSGAGNITNAVQQAGQLQNNQQVQLQQAIKRAQLGLLSPQELASIQGNQIDYGQAALAGLASVVPGFLGGQVTAAGAAAIGAGGGGAAAAGGAAAGAAFSGAGIALGALGAFGGFLLGVRNSIKGQQTVSIAKDTAVLKKGEARLKALIADTNLNPENAPENIALFYKTLNAIDIAHARLARTANSDLSKALSVGGFEKLSEFEIFDNYNRQFMIQKFNVALAAPNPQFASQITQEDYNLLLEE